MPNSCERKQFDQVLQNNGISSDNENIYQHNNLLQNDSEEVHTYDEEKSVKHNKVLVDNDQSSSIDDDIDDSYDISSDDDFD